MAREKDVKIITCSSKFYNSIKMMNWEFGGVCAVLSLKSQEDLRGSGYETV